MDSDELIWGQVKETHEYIRFVAEQGLTWFAWGVGINAAAAWAILANNITLHTSIVPGIFVSADILSGVVCFLLPRFYYEPGDAAIRSLIQKLTESKDTELSQYPAFPLYVWRAVSWCMAGFLVFLALMWFVGICSGDLLGRKQ